MKRSTAYQGEKKYELDIYDQSVRYSIIATINKSGDLMIERFDHKYKLTNADTGESLSKMRRSFIIDDKTILWSS